MGFLYAPDSIGSMEPVWVALPASIAAGDSAQDALLDGVLIPGRVASFQPEHCWRDTNRVSHAVLPRACWQSVGHGRAGCRSLERMQQPVLNVLKVSTQIYHRFEQIFGVTGLGALAFKSCDAPSLRGNDLISLCNPCGGEGKFLHKATARGHGYSREMRSDGAKNPVFQATGVWRAAAGSALTVSVVGVPA
jgi:hypothetical protein